jgi:hypothetical protein
MSFLAEVQTRRPRPSAMTLALWSEYRQPSPVHATPHAAALHCSIVTCWGFSTPRFVRIGSLRYNSRLTLSGVF